MKFAILADVHANLEAFEAVLRDAKDQRCTQYVFLGDIVGYNTNPNECVELVRSMNAPCVKGNHDEYCATDQPLDDFSPKAARAVLWTRKQLTADHKQWLSRLPYVFAVHDFTIVHATLNAPQNWEYVLDKLAALANFVFQKTPVCFYGHTHAPIAFVTDTQTRGGTFAKLQIEPAKRYFVNPGSVGQPRDGDPRASYAIYDIATAMITLRRVEYDVNTARKKAADAGLF